MIVGTLFLRIWTWKIYCFGIYDTNYGFRNSFPQNLNTENGCKWREEHIESSNFVTNKDIDKIIAEVESTFTSELESGDRGKAVFDLILKNIKNNNIHCRKQGNTKLYKLKNYKLNEVN